MEAFRYRQALLVTALVAPISCAPPQSFRPAAALPPERDQELGIGVSRIGRRPFVNEPVREVARAWWTKKLGTAWSLSTLLAFDASALAAGAALRLDVVRRGKFGVATEAELGFGWAAVGVPVSVRPLDGLQIYCGPRIGNWGPALTPFLPCGVGVEVMGDLILRGEAEVSWAGLEPYNRRWHFGLGVAHQW